MAKCSVPLLAVIRASASVCRASCQDITCWCCGHLNIADWSFLMIDRGDMVGWFLLGEDGCEKDRKDEDADDKADNFG